MVSAIMYVLTQLLTWLFIVYIQGFYTFSFTAEDQNGNVVACVKGRIMLSSRQNVHVKYTL